MSLADQLWCPTSVQVTVLQARGLKVKGKSGTNDAYAVMQVGKEKFQTSVVEKTVAPMWKEEATFDLPPLLQGGGGPPERSTLHVHVLHRALVGPDKLLGQAVINLVQLSEDDTRNKTEWFKLLDKAGKPNKDRGEVLLDIQFMRNNMTASMIDLSAAGKSRSRLSKFKDKVRGKKKELDPASVPSLTQVLTDSEEEEANDDAEGKEGKDGKSKKHKMKSLFAPKTNLQKNMSQSMSVLPAKNSSLSGSQSSGLNVDSSEGKKKFKFSLHKRSGSSDSKDSFSGRQKQAPVEQSNLCINGSHVYCEEPPPRSARIGSSFSLNSSGHGSMEDVPESSPPPVDSLKAVREYSPWIEEEDEEDKEDNMDELKEEEKIRMEEERKRKDEETLRRQQEDMDRLAEEKLRQEEEKKREQDMLRRKDEEERLAKEKLRQEEEERAKREEEERIQEEMEKRREEEERIQEEKEKRRREEEERAKREEEERIQEEKEKRRREEEEMAKREEEERIQEEKERRQEEERMREAEQKRLAEEKRRIEEEERRKLEEEKRWREEEEKIREEKERKRQEEERKLAEEKRLKEEEERAEEERRQMEKELVRKREEMRQREEEERLKKEEMKRLEEKARKEKEYERLVEERRVKEEERIRKEEEERVRMEREKIQREQEERRRKEEEEILRKQELEKLAKDKLRQEEEKRRREEEERIQKEKRQEEERVEKEKQERIRKEEERARKEKEEKERVKEMRRQEEEERVRREERAEKERKEEESRKLEKLAREEEKERENKTKEMTSMNPFDENFSPEPQQSSQALPSTRGSVVSAEKDLVNAQREKGPAPQPPGRNQSERLKEETASTRHLSQTNKQSKEKDVKTVSVPPQRSVQVIAPLNRSPKDLKGEILKNQTNATTSKHGKRPAPSRPLSVEDDASPGPKTNSSVGRTSHRGVSETKQVRTVPSLNPFEDDEDENEVCWPPVGSQSADKDATSQGKIRSSKVAHAPPPPPSVNQNSDEGPVTAGPDVMAPNDARDPLPEVKGHEKVLESPNGESNRNKVVKEDGPPANQRRLLTVKPLNPLEQQEETDNKPTGPDCSGVQHEKKVDPVMTGPYSQLTREELIALVLKQENQLADRDKKISELELYIDNLLVRVIEEQPSILMSMSSLK